jgi:metallo-beta-lactamase class B
LPCDVFLAPHPSFFNMAERFEKQKQSKTNPFVDTAAFKSYIGSAEQKFLSQLEQERK